MKREDLFLHREFSADELDIRKDDKDGYVRMRFPASSELKVERFFGTEMLSHEKGAVRLDRAKRGAMPLLFNHDRNDPLGVVEKADVRDSRMYTDVKFFKTERAAEVISMIEGGLRNVSIGYRLHVVEENKKDGTFVARDWEPFEVSVVTVPVDSSVGIGRQLEEFDVRMVRTSSPAVPAVHTRSPAMEEKSKEQLAAEAEAAEKSKAKAAAAAAEQERMEKEAREKVRNASAEELEASRIRAIKNLAQANRITDNVRDAWVSQGYSMEQVSKDLLSILEQRGKTDPQPASKIGLNGGEAKQFSLTRAILACKDNDWKNAGFELECSRAVAQKLNKVAEPTKFYVPFEVLQRNQDLGAILAAKQAMGLPISVRDLTVATAGAGGFLVGTENQGFIEMLRNRSVVMSVGARRLSGLQGNVTIPRQSAAATAVWLANEASTITESQQTFVQLALSPKSVGAYTEISRQLLLQSSPAVEGIVTDDLAQVVALAADLAALEGSGAGGQPTGLANTAGIGNVAAGSLTYAKVLEFQTDVAAGNVRPQSGAYVTHPDTAAVLMQKQRFTSTDTPLWVGNIWDGQVSGFPGASTNQLASGVIDFGDWQELVIAEWGVLEVEVNPYANFQAGIVGVRAIYSLDIGIRRPFAFSRGSALTA